MEENTDVIFDGIEIAELKGIIRVVGVGGAGGNVINYMAKKNIQSVTLIACNTDAQVLASNKATIKVQLGPKLTKGLGAGNLAEQGRASATESLESIKSVLEGAEMVFVAAGMGGGTGTGAAPVVAQAAKEKGILTIGVISIPFFDEGNPRIKQAIEGIKNMQEHVDSLLVVNSERLYSMYTEEDDIELEVALDQINDVLATAAQGIVNVIMKESVINLDLADVRTAMTDSGTAIMGSGEASGPDRAARALEAALNSPLLNYNDIRGARHVLVNVRTGKKKKIGLREKGFILRSVRQRCSEINESNIMWGVGCDEDRDDESLTITIVATGFPKESALDLDQKSERMVVRVDSDGNIFDVVNEDEGANKIPLKPADTSNDDEINRLYGNVKKEEMLSTKNLPAPLPVPLEKLQDEEVISRIEEVPAYQRRSNT